MMRKLISVVFVIAFQFLQAQNLQITSPDEKIAISFQLDEGVPLYNVSRNGTEIIKKSKLGFIIKDQKPLDGNFKIESHEINSFDETWTQVWGEEKNIRNHFNQLKVSLTDDSSPKRELNIFFRAYDDGIAFRYEIPEQESFNNFEIMDELTEFVLTGNYSSWWIKAYQWNRYEYLYQNSPLDGIDTVHTPFTVEVNDSLYLSFHEAALVDYSSLTLENMGNHVLKANLVPWSDGTKVKASAPMKSPWRTVQISETPGGLITSYLILNLNEPNKLDYISWIKPQKYIGIWWEMHINKSTWASGEKHGATTENTKRYIDFAAKHGFDGVLVEGWNEGWDGDWTANGEIFSFTKSYPDFNLDDVTDYAASKGVKLIGHHETGAAVLNYEKQMEDAFALYHKHGVNTVKTGYVGWGQNIKRVDEEGNIQKEWHHGQFMVRHYQKVVETAAKYHIMIDAHEPIKDTGLRRTWPNFMTREGARGQEYDAWSDDGGNPPDHTTIIPFTRLLSGPMDFTPGIFDILFEDDPPVDNRVNTTLAKQLAHYVVLYSPLQMAADLPENYEANLGAFKFIKDVPVDWEFTRVPNAKIGDYITIVRKDRSSEDWYLGSITDENARNLKVKLDFLTPGKKYTAEIYKDGANADWKTNPLEIEITSQIVDSNTEMELKLAPGGGQAIRFSPAK